MKSIFAKWAPSYIKRGFSPLPISPGLKLPSNNGFNLRGWQVYGEAVASADTLRKWSRGANGISVATGYNGLIAIDADDARAYPAIREVFGHLCPPAKVGQRGATAFFFDPTGMIGNRNIRAKDKPDGTRDGMLVEILSKGRQAVLPPTIHPKTGKPYRWRNGTLEHCRPADLPVVTQAHIDDLERLLAPIAAERKVIAFEKVEPRRIDFNDRERKRMEAYALAALTNQVNRLGMQGKGGRNGLLFSAVCTLGKFVHSGVLGQDRLQKSLIEACERNGLIKDNGTTDALKTIARGLKFSVGDALPNLAERTYA